MEGLQKQDNGYDLMLYGAYERYEQITQLNQCVQHVIWVEEVWEIGGRVMVNTLVLKTQDEVTIKESK